MDAHQLGPDAAAEIATFAFELGNLKREPRKGWRQALVPNPESVADHTCRTAQLASIIAAGEGGDPATAAHMAVWHDSQETRSGDNNKTSKPFMTLVDHETITAAQVQRLPEAVRNAVQQTVSEYEAQATVEAVAARDADKLECLFQAIEYRAAGNTLMQEWITDSYAALKTTTAIRIADAALTTSPLRWRQ
ncbi:HD domain-containing protein [Nocardia abscessus]|uniref:HD domain-containing protein n=1 Tax=Nocardia abscessus TaxID=120957 RepID=UPI0002EBCBCB|nr:HD domain-containing protein [Nocardia abscessus]MCC3328278.1 HD domain-containing protein [Nocardia abscessus]